MKHFCHALIASALIAFAGCSQESTPTPSSTEKSAATPVAELPTGLFGGATPVEPKPLHVVRASAKVGDTVVMTGYIGGREKPFTEGRALFLMVDGEKAPPCVDGCKTPWDSCCTAAEDIAANSATIQVVDAKGQLLKTSLEGKGGLAAGSRIAVTGKVREASESALVVDATSVAVVVKATFVATP